MYLEARSGTERIKLQFNADNVRLGMRRAVLVPIIPLVRDCQFGVSPVNYSDSDSDSWASQTLFWLVKEIYMI